MTTEQQYKALAAMLPEKLIIETFNAIDGKEKFIVVRLLWRNTLRELFPSELLGLCYEIEEGLTTREQLDYVQELKRGWCSPFYNWTHASAERRIEALAKVKGIK